ncbi:MAG: TonB-dependent receptor, partial [Acidobacteriota bacterium]|nr:TonB-dependent receptor [Acidobacteriota bacterium]
MPKFLLVAFVCLAPLFAQTATLRGRVTDESGAVVPGAIVTLAGPVAKTTTTGNDGSYSFNALAPGDYTAQASAPDLALPAPIKLVLKAGAQTLNLQLRIASTMQQVTVEESAGPTVSTDSANNAGALVLRGDDLQALADDPDDLQADLQALAGPAAGPNGGAIYIDGFSGGQLPAKESIREIRINQNPFSPEYDKLGYGRIEIFTKPGTDKFHGIAQFNLGTDWWNSRNPYAQQKAPFLLKEYEGNVSGPIGKRASFFLDARKESVDNGAVINGSILDPATLGIVNPFTSVFLVPQRRVSASPRFDYQIDPKNTLTVRYSYNRVDIADAGVGGFNLVSRAYDDLNQFHTLQISETAVLSASVINETRFQFFRAQDDIQANSLNPAIQVLGAFNGGGAQVGRSNVTQTSYEFQNYTSIARGAHSWRFGARLREQQNSSISPRNFGGTFTFGGGLAPKLDGNNQPAVDSHGMPVLGLIDSIERYRRTLLFQQLGYAPALIRTLGGGATQFSQSLGNPALSASQFDAGIFAGDDWRVRPNLTLSLGLRYEMQTNIHDWRDVAPRIGIAWAPGAGVKNSRPQLVIRAGFGTFYDRFSLADTITSLRYNGILQQQFVIANPDFFPAIPPLSALTGSQSAQVIQELSRNLRAPYILQSAIGVERQLPKNTTVAVTYANSHGLHLLRSRDITAPLNPVFLIES